MIVLVFLHLNLCVKSVIDGSRCTVAQGTVNPSRDSAGKEFCYRCEMFYDARWIPRVKPRVVAHEDPCCLSCLELSGGIFTYPNKQFSTTTIRSLCSVG